MEKVVSKIRLADLFADPEQPRKTFDEESLLELGNSIKSEGQKTAALIRKHPTIEGKFMIIAGERRFRASKAVGLEDLECIVSDEADEKSIFITQIVENDIRQNLAPMESAASWRTAVLVKGIDIGELAEKLGKTVGTVANYIELCNLPAHMQKLIDRGEIPLSIAHELVKFPLNKVETALKAALKNPMNAKTMRAGLEAYRQSDGQISFGVDYIQKMYDPKIEAAGKAFDAMQGKISQFLKNHGTDLPKVVLAKKKNPNQLNLFIQEIKKFAVNLEKHVMDCEAQKIQAKAA